MIHPTPQDMDWFVKEHNIYKFGIDFPTDKVLTSIDSYQHFISSAAIVKMEMEIDNFYNMVNTYIDLERQKDIRNKSYTVAKAYEDYMVLLKLSGG